MNWTLLHWTLRSRFFVPFKSGKKEMILRVCYDTEGKGMEREPQRIFVVPDGARSGAR